jgi:hypothetical protein
MGVENAIGGLYSATGIVAVTVSSVDQLLTKPCRAIMVGVSGDVAVTMADGSTGILPALNPGTLYPIAAISFQHTGTTASGIKALL